MNLIRIADTPQACPVTQKRCSCVLFKDKQPDPATQQPGSPSARVKTAFENREYDEKYEK